MARRVFITVAEVSGDKHAAQLIHSLRQLDHEMIIEGIGGPLMQQVGATIHRETVGKAAMGWRGALRVVEVYKLLRWTRRHFATNKPDLYIGVDSPSMSFNFAKVAREFGVPVLQYVAPQLWAWQEWRIKKVRRLVDRLACILPFEEKYFRDHGVNATFVGHPLFDELPPDRHANAARPSSSDRPVIGLLAGSRRSEAEANFPHQLDVAAMIRRTIARARFLAPTTSATNPVVEALVRQRRIDVEIGIDRFDELVPQCDLCITVSGTATLHVASHGVPMIVVYRGSALLWQLIGRWMIKTRTYALVNLLHGTADHIVPEFIPWYGSNQPVADRAIELLQHPDQLQQQRDRLKHLVRTLDNPGASMHVARTAMEMMRK